MLTLRITGITDAEQMGSNIVPGGFNALPSPSLLGCSLPTLFENPTTNLMSGIAWECSVNRKETEHTALMTHFLGSVCDKVTSETVDTDSEWYCGGGVDFKTDSFCG